MENSNKKRINRPRGLSKDRLGQLFSDDELFDVARLCGGLHSSMISGPLKSRFKSRPDDLYLFYELEKRGYEIEKLFPEIKIAMNAKQEMASLKKMAAKLKQSNPKRLKL